MLQNDNWRTVLTLKYAQQVFNRDMFGENAMCVIF